MSIEMARLAEPLNIQLVIDGVSKVVVPFDPPGISTFTTLGGLSHFPIAKRISDAILSEPLHEGIWTESVFFLPTKTLDSSKWALLSASVNLLIGLSLIVSLTAWNAFVAVSQLAILLSVKLLKRFNFFADSAFSVVFHGCILP